MRRKTDEFTDAEFAPLLEPESEMVRVLYSEGVLRAAHGRLDTPGAVLILEAASLEAANAAIARLPLYEKGMLDAQVIPVGPYRGFGPRG